MCTYDMMISFSEELAEVSKNGKYGYINKVGQEIIPCIYDNVAWYPLEGIVVAKDDKGSYIITFK